MKWYLKTLYVLGTLAAFVVIMAGCKKDAAPALVIDGFDVLDVSGNAVDHIGPADQDWTFNNSLSAAEIALFDFPTDEDLQHTSAATLSSKVVVYPNPAALVQALHVTASDSVLMKIVIVDRNMKVLTKGAVKFTGSLDITLDYSSDSELFPNGASLRFYYSFSAEGKPHFKAGYGDIKICYSATSGGSYLDCF